MKALGIYACQWNLCGDIWECSALLAEKNFLFSKSKLNYRARMKVDDQLKHLKFSESLLENKSDLSHAPASGIEEQSLYFSQKYQFKFDHQDIRKKVEALAATLGYTFEYQLSL